uniref:Uncharacterized protein LOC111133461 isoform X2 n=1 Tax=Crassostrea virginica TaxID=6565 RepID=A0A8B8EDJ8_CRAVI|nr:uncharacterized protein LOC111133461 isoform X2 [Crassostrea virginica]
MDFDFWYVDRCPKDEEEWKIRAEKRDCYLSALHKIINDNVKKLNEFVSRRYHCALTGDGDRLVEVCARSVHIHGHSCTEFNIRGNLVQESFKKCQDACPNVYNSTEAYKYQTCYDRAGQTNEFNVTSTSIFELALEGLFGFSEFRIRHTRGSCSKIEELY